MKTIKILGAYRLCVAFLFGAILVAAAGTASGQMQKPEREDGVLAIGVASLSGGNTAAARRQALSHALEKGVETYLLKRLGGKAVAGQFARFVQELVPAARDEIANYNILGEEEISDRYRVLVRVRVNEQTLDRVLDERGFLLEEGPPIRILFMVSQRRPGAAAPAYWWKDPSSGSGMSPLELSLNRVFEGMGFVMASRTMKTPEGEGAEDLKGQDLTLVQAAEWGRLCAADVVVLGSSVLSDDVVSVHLRAVDVAGESVMSEQGAQSSLNPNLEGDEQIREGIERAAKSVSARLAPEIREAFRQVETPEGRITLTLSGIGSFSQLQQFTRFLMEDIPGVDFVTQTRFKGDTVSFSIGYRSGPDELLEALLNRPEIPFPVNAKQTEDGGILVTPL